jgi:hypothetical protein
VCPNTSAVVRMPAASVNLPPNSGPFDASSDTGNECQ